MPDGFEGDVYFDSNGSLTEHRLVGEHEVIVHYDDIPEKDLTMVDGFRCTTALRRDPNQILRTSYSVCVGRRSTSTVRQCSSPAAS